MKMNVVVLSVVVLLLFIANIQQTEAGKPEKEVNFPAPGKKPTREDCKKACANKYTNGVMSKVIVAKLTGKNCYCKYQEN
uniref:U-scoloptoxin(15)-Sm1a n=1 Tax=Scolopendra morsitans TaxID=943129 RepID=TXF1A_SCOMO|nr:RecName: Full=U-scoloptoxin(15)-Sm1a; Short=U-SLPTX(15)-Sm1a; Flags: Precursor [Scolopendra morsitans]